MKPVRIAVLLGDDVIASRVPCLQQLLEVYQRWGGTVLSVQEVRAEDTGKYGIVRPEPVGPGLYRVQDLVEKPRPEEAPSTLAVLGRYIIQPEVFDFLEKQEPGAGGEIQLTSSIHPTKGIGREPLLSGR
ncbi:MAG: sugar phosphate nucleotidyltransferase [Bacillota bacterium]